MSHAARQVAQSTSADVDPALLDRSVFDPARHALFLRAFTTHEAAVRAYVRRLVPSRADADDVTQEVAVVLWAKFHQFREGGDFRAWAFGIARYEVLSWLRDRGRDRMVLDTDVVELLADDSAISPRQLDQQRAALESCLEKMDPLQKSLLLRSYSSEHTIAELAKASGRSTGGFYQWLYRMRRLLLECIGREVAGSRCS
ncbi:MAG: sigma-70 family RNA polymerase sigma factor [Pirellulaceae bacterium]|nr:sigma-70 family RNA polymerase sigma factor [Pirellulaceae bacterium]